MNNKINKGDLVKMVFGNMFGTKTGVVLKLNRFLPSGKLKARVHFYDGFEQWINIIQLEKLNK